MENIRNHDNYLNPPEYPEVKFEEIKVYEVWQGNMLCETFDNKQEAREYIADCEYPETFEIQETYEDRETDYEEDIEEFEYENYLDD